MKGALTSRIVATAVAAALLLGPGLAAACFINGQISGVPNTTAPQYGAWKYTMVVTWDTGTRYALSHFNLFIDDGTHCSCAALDASLDWAYPIGSAGVPGGCGVPYEGILNCNGDPSIDLPGHIIKFEPRSDGSCDTGPTGTGTFVFYSDYAPAPIALNNLFLTDKAGLTTCSGMLTGYFPGLPCDPTPTQDTTWGSLKSRYGD